MPVIKSAKKRVKVAAKATARNSRYKRQMRESLKAFAAALSSGKTAEIAKQQRAAVSALDVAAKKNIIHANKAARKKSQLAKRAKEAGVKPGSELSRSPAKTGAGKAARKSTTGKPAAKKTAVKKPVAKKAPSKKK